MNIQNANLTFKGTLTPLSPSKVKYIVVHHIEAECATSQDIHNWHLANGWSGAGYNEYIRKDGSVYILRGDNVGAHALGYNEVSYGIALEGNYQYNGNVPDAQMNSLAERIKYHKARFNANVVKHSQICSTSCPGLKFPWNVLVSKLKEEVKPMITDINVALDLLVTKGIINSKEYWLKTVDIVKYQKEFIINIANFVK